LLRASEIEGATIRESLQYGFVPFAGDEPHL
jgi:hypothetical protein